jgi:hypothetical protein
MTRTKNDYISEEDFTQIMNHYASNPQNDSPGDSDSDAGAEFNMGMNFDLLENEEGQEKDEHPMSEKTFYRNTRIENAKAINSELPAPSLEISCDYNQ